MSAATAPIVSGECDKGLWGSPIELIVSAIAATDVRLRCLRLGQIMGRLIAHSLNQILSRFIVSERRSSGRVGGRAEKLYGCIFIKSITLSWSLFHGLLIFVGV